MGGAASTPEVPGGGTEGYHVLKVWLNRCVDLLTPPLQRADSRAFVGPKYAIVTFLDHTHAPLKLSRCRFLLVVLARCRQTRPERPPG